jgi:hypothetical protein
VNNRDKLSKSQRKAEVIDLYLSGLKYREIRDKTGYSIGVISKYVNEAIDETNRAISEGTGKLKRREVMKLERLMMPFWQKAMDGDVQAGAMCLKIMERYSSLLGLDAPFRIESMTNDELIKRIAELGEAEGLSGFAPGGAAQGHLLSATIQA